MNTLIKHYHTAIVGAGAAGLFAGACLALRAPQCPVILLEKNRLPGRKLLMAGAGQCNLTHSGDIKEFISHYGPAGKAIRSVLYAFGNRQTYGFFEKLGVPLITREDGKVFPKSLEGKDVYNALFHTIQDNGGRLETGVSVSGLCPPIQEGSPWTVQWDGGHSIEADHVIVATGGCSYPTTGSDGSMFSVLKALGLEILPPRPALVPIFTADYPYGELSGISFSPAEISLLDSKTKKKVASNRDDLLLTHKGLSGPGILNLSRSAAAGQLISLCYLPGQRREILEKELKALSAGEKKQAIHFLGQHLAPLPRRFLECLCHRCGIDPTLKASQLTGAQLAAAAALVTEDRHIITGLGGFQTAMVTAGGVALSEISLKSMESKTYPGLYLAGEVLDVDGDTGGYNLQFAFSSAHLAVSSLLHLK